MRLKIVVVDLEIPSTVKKWALRLGLPVALVLGGGVLAFASNPPTFTQGETLQASDLQAMSTDIAALQGQVATLQAQPPAVPSGTVVAFAGTIVPAGWALCDGSSVSRTGAYANLFAAIGTTAGAPDSADFNLPDYRGYFLRGLDSSGNVDVDVSGRTAEKAGGNVGPTVGSVETSAFAVHTHGATDTGHVHGAPNSAGHFMLDGSQAGGTGANAAGGGGYVLFGTTGVGYASISVANAGSSSETRPTNVTVNYIIKL